MHHFDLHCDTLNRIAESAQKGGDVSTALLDNTFDLSVNRGLLFDRWVQVFAAFTDDTLRGEDAYRNFLSQAGILQNTIAASDKIVAYQKDSIKEGVCNAMLSVENGAALGGKLERIAAFAEMGVKIFSLVWDGENELAGGVRSEIGLTAFGREAVAALEREKIIIDVSHLNTLGFWELCEVATRPFIATHSNCFEVCPHKRNLDDLQIEEIIKRGGLIGLNFYPVFINGESDASFQELRRHIRYILAMGGEDVLAVGSDFDGGAMISRLDRIEKIPDWHLNLLKHFDADLVDKITFGNAQRFFAENL